jgi:hypothetical protein
MNARVYKLASAGVDLSLPFKIGPVNGRNREKAVFG